MDLWIRRQDGLTLLKCEDLRAANEVIEVDLKTGEKTTSYCIKNEGTTLGYYNSKERCIEVLTEIQEAMKRGRGNIVFYLMPEE